MKMLGSGAPGLSCLLARILTRMMPSGPRGEGVGELPDSRTHIETGRGPNLSNHGILAGAGLGATCGPQSVEEWPMMQARRLQLMLQQAAAICEPRNQGVLSRKLQDSGLLNCLKPD